MSAEVQGEALPQPRERSQRRGLGQIWFGWWVAGCLVALAMSTHQQLQIQKRILVQSRLLEGKLAESKAVSASMNEQLGNVARLDAATRSLSLKLQRIHQVNGEIKENLLAMEATVDTIGKSIGNLGQQAARSHELLQEIARQSGQLHGTLTRSHATGETVSGRLRRLVELQEALNADLAEMSRKTEPLDRLAGGR